MMVASKYTGFALSRGAKCREPVCTSSEVTVRNFISFQLFVRMCQKRMRHTWGSEDDLPELALTFHDAILGLPLPEQSRTLTATVLLRAGVRSQDSK